MHVPHMCMHVDVPDRVQYVDALLVYIICLIMAISYYSNQ